MLFTAIFLRAVKAAFLELEKNNVHRRNTCPDVYHHHSCPNTQSKQA